MINNTKQKITSFLAFCLIIAATGIITSCEDEVIDRVVEIPGDTVTVLAFNHIISFQITEFSADTVLEAVSRDDSLIVYWPSYRPLPAAVAPDITVAKGATITPASGASVPFTTGTTYTVTAEDQSEQRYILKVVIYQPEPVYGTDGVITTIELPEGEAGILSIVGDLFIPEIEKTSMYLISWDTGEETKLKTNSVTTNSMEFEIPSDIPRKYYRSRLISGTRTVDKQDSIWVKFPEPFIDWEYEDLVLTPGETFQLMGERILDIEKVEIQVGFDFIPLEIISFTPVSITLRLPDDFPIGAYFGNTTRTHSPWGNNGGITLSTIFLEVIAP